MLARPRSLREVAERADGVGTFGYELADWLKTLRAGITRPQAAAAIAEEPALLRDRFPKGSVADAWLAAYAEYLAGRIGHPVPRWAKSAKRVSSEPWFASEHPDSRLRALRDSPPPFKNRNLFTEKVDLPLRLRAGRPPKSADEKRRANAERQRRFRARRAVEMELLRDIVAAGGP